MAVIALTSASGSPGVTTTAVGLSLLWPRPVLLVEADPTGGSGILAGYFRGSHEYDAGLVELALSAAPIADALREVARPIPGTRVSFIAGTRSRSQANALHDVWRPLAEALGELESNGQDVIVDCGRLGLAHAPEPLTLGADLTLLVTRTNLPALSASRAWFDAVAQPGLDLGQTGLLLIGAGQPYAAAEVSAVVELPVIASIADDAESAAVFHRGAAPPKHFDTGPFVRSLRAAIESMRGAINRRRSGLLERAHS